MYYKNKAIQVCINTHYIAKDDSISSGVEYLSKKNKIRSM